VILQQALNALALGSIYALIALGYTMVYGVLRLINFAHGDVYMLGAFTGLFASHWLGATAAIDRDGSASFLQVAGVLAISMLVAALIGVLIERIAYRPLRHASRLTALITAIGVSMLIEYAAQAILKPDPRGFPKLIANRHLIETPNFVLLLQTVVIVAVALGLMLMLQFIVYRTRVGRAMRAVAHDQGAAALMGINADFIISLTFALGSALAAAAGVLNSILQPTIDPLMGVTVGIKAFVAAVLGGIGNVPGAVLGGLLLGCAETLVGASRFSDYSDAISFAVLIAVLLLRPAGLLGQTTAEKV
jgi:branched-chain amino acid transport system permease protein